MRITIPVTEKNGINSGIEEHFGRACFFVIYDTESKNLEEIEIKKSEHGICSPVKTLLEFGIDAVFALGMGMKARILFEENGVKVFTGNFHSVQEVVENLDKLGNFQGGCEKC